MIAVLMNGHARSCSGMAQWRRGSAAPNATSGELREIESLLSSRHPGTYAGLKRQISESKLDCMYVEGGGGGASLRLGRLIGRKGRK